MEINSMASAKILAKRLSETGVEEAEKIVALLDDQIAYQKAVAYQRKLEMACNGGRILTDRELGFEVPHIIARCGYPQTYEHPYIEKQFKKLLNDGHGQPSK